MKNTVDRKSRDALVTAINRYLDGETTAFQFDDEISSITWDDPTVTYVASSLWHFYDDCKDHKVRLAKDEWDYFQRLILVLSGDGHIEVHKQRRWDYSQLAAVAALLLFLYVGRSWGLGIQLFALAIPFGIVSIAISRWRNRSAPDGLDKTAAILAPFSSILELISLRRDAVRFQKRKYPAGMKRFRIRTPLEQTAVVLQGYAAWLFFSPLVLLFQALPRTETDTHVVMEQGE